MCCLTFALMCVKIEASLCHQSLKLLIAASRTCMHNFFPSFFLSKKCIHKTWNFTLMLLVKVLLVNTTFILTPIKLGFLRVVFSGGEGGSIWLTFIFQEELFYYQYNFIQLSLHTITSYNLFKICWKWKNADIIYYKLTSLVS